VPDEMTMARLVQPPFTYALFIFMKMKCANDDWAVD
jgi:hypothetical protein